MGRPVKPQDTTGSDLGDLAIDRAAEVPIGVQLAWTLRTRIGDGTLAPGQRLPGLRDLAVEIGVNANTVRAVYQRLESEGLVDSQQGVGTFVAAAATTRSRVQTIAADAAREAQASGVDPRLVAAALYVAAGPEHAPADSATEHRRALRAQIGTLEQAIVAIEAEHPGLVLTGEQAAEEVGPALLSAAQLERVRTQLVHRLATLGTAIEAAQTPAGPQQAASPADAAAAKTGTSRAPRRPAGRPATAES